MKAGTFTRPGPLPRTAESPEVTAYFRRSTGLAWLDVSGKITSPVSLRGLLCQLRRAHPGLPSGVKMMAVDLTRLDEVTVDLAVLLCLESRMSGLSSTSSADVIEPAAGVDRATLAFIADAYYEEEVEGRKRTVLRLHPKLAPVKVAVMPLVNKEGQPEKAREIFDSLRRKLGAEYDEGGSIGKRYRRQDEIGTPWGVTIDHETADDGKVTLRDRDTLTQERVPVEGLPELLLAKLDEGWTAP